MREDGRHVFTAERSQSPRLVKATITTSIQYCDRAASFTSGYIASARSWASTSPDTCPAISAPTCTYQMPEPAMIP